MEDAESTGAFTVEEKEQRKRLQAGMQKVRNTKCTNGPVSEVDQVVGSGVAEVSIRDLYFILQPDTPGECALFISITEADITVVLKKGLGWERRLKTDHRFTATSHGDLLETFELGVTCSDSGVFKRLIRKVEDGQ